MLNGSNKTFDFGPDQVTIRIQEFLKNFYRCGIGTIVRILRDQLLFPSASSLL